LPTANRTVSFSASANNSGYKVNATGSMPVVGGLIKVTGNASASGAWNGQKPVVTTKVNYGLNL